MNNLLELRKKIKKKKPDFVRQNIGKKALKKCWRQPKGMHSKLRRKKAGHIKHPSPGFSSPKAVRHLHPSGLKPRIIFNINQLNNIQKDEGIIIASVVGQKKKLDLIKKIRELKLQLLNIKNIDEFIKKIEEKKKTRKEKKKTKKQKKKEAKIQKPIAKSKELTQEEKEKKEKEKKRKILEAKQ